MNEPSKDRPLPADMDATDRAADPRPDRSLSAAPSPEGNDRASGEPRSLSARNLQQDDGKVDAEPGSDADQANEVPHVG